MQRVGWLRIFLRVKLTFVMRLTVQVLRCKKGTPHHGNTRGVVLLSKAFECVQVYLCARMCARVCKSDDEEENSYDKNIFNIRQGHQYNTTGCIILVLYFILVLLIICNVNSALRSPRGRTTSRPVLSTPDACILDASMVNSVSGSPACASRTSNFCRVFPTGQQSSSETSVREEGEEVSSVHASYSKCIHRSISHKNI